MTIYQGSGFGTPGPGEVMVISAQDQRPLSPGYDDDELPSHSPDGFQAGYNGSGPAQLAAALLHDALGPDISQKHYMAFKRNVISKLNGDQWQLTSQEIESWYEERVYQSGKVD